MGICRCLSPADLRPKHHRSDARANAQRNVLSEICRRLLQGAPRADHPELGAHASAHSELHAFPPKCSHGLPELQGTSKLDVTAARATLQFIEAWRPVQDEMMALANGLKFTMASRKATLASDALQVYSIAKAIARDPGSTASLVSNLKRDLEFTAAIRRGRLHRDTFAADAAAGRSVPDDLEHVPATAWLHDDAVIEDSRIYKASVAMPRYGAVVTLLSIREQILRQRDEPADDDLDPVEFTLERKHWPKKRQRVASTFYANATRPPICTITSLRMCSWITA